MPIGSSQDTSGATGSRAGAGRAGPTRPPPIAHPSCALDPGGLQAQLERYRALGASATSITRGPRSLEVTVGRHPASELIEQLVHVERACCPFFTLSWDDRRRVLGIGVSAPGHELALEAIAHALGHPSSG